MHTSSQIPTRLGSKKDASSPLKPWQSPVILPLSRCLSTPVQNGKPVVPATATTATPQPNYERTAERSGSGLFGRSNPFDTDFSEKQLIAEGGFGKIFKCKSNVDSRWYAVKLEQFWFKPETYFNPADVRDVMMNEALVLAGLDHENVCRYFNTWVLGSLIPAVNKGKRQEAEPERPRLSPTYSLIKRTSSPAGSTSPKGETTTGRQSQEISSSRNWEDSSEDEDDDVEVSSSNYSDASSYEPDDDYTASFDDLGFEMAAPEADGPKVSPRASLARSQRLAAGKASPPKSPNDDNTSSRFHQKPGRFRLKTMDSPAATPGALITQIDVYIQMALYEGNSLRHWMEQRKSGDIDAFESMRIFQQIVSGLKYIHKQGLVHRDIKPANIFLTRESCVKIGDFGLSKNTLQTSLHLHPSRYICGDGEDSLQSLSRGVDDEMEEISAFSAGVGTPLYSSPEQTHGRQAPAAPSDVYSLGILLCELFCTFTTQMERYVELNNVRKGQVPSSVSMEYPEVAALISAMVLEDPALRPSCAEILDSDIFQRCYQKEGAVHALPITLRGSTGSSSVGEIPPPVVSGVRPRSMGHLELTAQATRHSTVVDLLLSVSRLEQEHQTLLLKLEAMDKQGHQADTALNSDCVRPPERYPESPVSSTGSPQVEFESRPTCTSALTGSVLTSAIHDLTRLSNERRRLLDCAMQKLQ
ncbi:hypothetical protein BBJ28_00021155 [Nothophytophthora sp. Chile5]|nr:hypothetical protein BBJ28_00021155 [Nothophytophthora sp. Chile5]